MPAAHHADYCLTALQCLSDAGGIVDIAAHNAQAFAGGERVMDMHESRHGVVAGYRLADDALSDPTGGSEDSYLHDKHYNATKLNREFTSGPDFGLKRGAKLVHSQSSEKCNCLPGDSFVDLRHGKYGLTSPLWRFLTGNVMNLEEYFERLHRLAAREKSRNDESNRRDLPPGA